MSLPLFTVEQVRDVLKKKKLGMEIFDEFPSDMKNVRHGIYIDDPATDNRVPYQLAINYGNNIYIADDTIRIILVSFQGDKLRAKATEAITSLVTDNVLFNGYHQRDFSMATDFLNRAEYRTYDFTLSRIELQ
jgi:hypothetical protein